MRKYGMIEDFLVIRLSLHQFRTWTMPLRFFSNLQKFQCRFHAYSMFQSKNLFSSAANCAFRSMAFTIFSVLESFDQSNPLAVQISHSHVLEVRIKPLKPSCGIIVFPQLFRFVQRRKSSSFPHRQLRLLCANSPNLQAKCDQITYPFTPQY